MSGGGGVTSTSSDIVPFWNLASDRIYQTFGFYAPAVLVDPALLGSTQARNSL